MKTLLQLYSARDYQPWDGVLGRTAVAGFTGVETFAAVFDDANVFRALADHQGLKLLKRYPFLGQAELENSGLRPHPGGAAGRPFMNTIGDLLPIALCGLTSL